jgi:hypothetical protein
MPSLRGSLRQFVLAPKLELVAPEQRGFAYAGATMAFALRDTVAGGKRTRELLRGPGAPHVPLAYTGIGFAMARLPKPYPLQGSPEYFPRAVDQGIGRALWFVYGADPVAVTAAVNRFAPARRPDLWSGVGLAATFTGGTDDLAELRDLAGEHWPQLGLGVVFAIKALADAGHVPEHSALAAEKLAGLTVPDAVAIADRTEADSSGPKPARHMVPPYEQWRNRIRAHFMATALSSVSRNRRHRAWPTSARSGTREVVNGSHGV